MAKYCSECGSALPQDARFCQSCGHPVQAPGTSPAQEGTSSPASTPVLSESPAPVPPPASTSAPAPAPIPVASVPEQTGGSRRNTFVLAGVGLLAVAGVGLWAGKSVLGTPQPTAAVVAASDDQPSSEKGSFYAVAEANLRDKPSVQNSSVVGSIKRGEQVSGTLVGEQDSGQWLQIDGTGQYVSVVNLSKGRPPVLTALDGSDRIVSGQCVMLEGPGEGAGVKVRLQSGAAVKRVGTTGDGFTEYGLPGGGVGYASAAAACGTRPSPAKWAVANTLIQLDAGDCGFGDVLKPYFDKAQAARPMDEVDNDAAEFLYPVQKTFHGLRVTAVLLGYEWQGVTFADPADKVRAVFRDLGFKFRENGVFIVPEDSNVTTSIQDMEPDAATGSRSKLTCGV